jgi:hypothetical protein
MFETAASDRIHVADRRAHDARAVALRGLLRRLLGRA